MGNYKDQKKKTKRKKGKKFVYKPKEEKVEKVNPFEMLSKKKFMKQGKAYDTVISEYNTKNVQNSFVDRRIGEGSKFLSQEDKMKLRFKAQQMINMKMRKNKFSLLDDDDGGAHDMLTHRGKSITDYKDLSDGEKSDDEIYDKLDNYMEEMDQNRAKMSRKEIIQNIINKSKLLKEEKQRIKQQNRDKIEMLDEGFTELSTLLKKRGRSFNKFNDDYDKYASSFVHAEKTHPTDRLKSEGEIEMEKELEQERLNKKRIKEELMNDSEEEKEKEDEVRDVEDKKKLTKKERIEKLIADRLNKAGKISKEDMIAKKKDEEGSDEENEEDNLSDLDEFDNKNEEGEDGEDFEDEEAEDGEDFDDDGDDGDGEDFDDEEGEDFDDEEEEEEEEIKHVKNKTSKRK